MKVGIIGLGEVGSAIKKLAEKKHNVFTKNRKIDLIKGNKIDILHICIHYSTEFEKTVVKAIKDYLPRLTIIESTVAPGTTERIYKKTKVLICHSPIRGIHPHLYKSIKTFVKYIGPTTPIAGKKVSSYYKNLDVKTEVFKDSKTSEIAKLFDTTYYAWNIIFQKELYKICQKQKVPFEQVYKKWNETYNEGYKKLKKANVIRPVLKDYPGKIGGHCLIPNCTILESNLSNLISKTILALNRKY
ncbi:MAG: hypothetical protein A2W22_03515 [Candidatus Levybacteria bacterium RBG_16_35_11]|nr:MAG: hypothetical protein A2W22_03515 [Candidatus Levybacteria bacterium RBG_16_35_11]